MAKTEVFQCKKWLPDVLSNSQFLFMYFAMNLLSSCCYINSCSYRKMFKGWVFSWFHLSIDFSGCCQFPIAVSIVQTSASPAQAPKKAGVFLQELHSGESEWRGSLSSKNCVSYIWKCGVCQCSSLTFLKYQIAERRLWERNPSLGKIAFN